MLREFASRFFHQLLGLRTFRSQAAFQGPGAQVQFARDPKYEPSTGRCSRSAAAQDLLPLLAAYFFCGCRPCLDLCPEQHWSISWQAPRFGGGLSTARANYEDKPRLTGVIPAVRRTSAMHFSECALRR